ncbi:MAG TPA: N-acyl homoserine lactonase family protein [Terriglobales bacterium]|nr:N-acyl homoserine lactonase family protein [Terriglobales bacterium]
MTLKHLIRTLESVWKRLALLFVVVCTATAFIGGQQLGKSGTAPTPDGGTAAPRSLRLYVFDCGKLTIRDPSSFGFTNGELATTDMSDPCFLIAHPKGTLLWEAGVLPDSVFTTTGSVTKGAATVTKPLKAQLAEIGYVPSDITYLAFSHCHGDHTGNANDFAGATWLVRQEERDAMFGGSTDYSGCWAPEHFSSLRNSKTQILTQADYDVFGDGTVVIKSAPGHTPGHQVLFVNLPKTGPVLLSGDLYHYPEERTHGPIPRTEFNREQTRASRAAVEAFLKKSGAQLWIQHDYIGNTKLRKSPAYYE